MKKTLKVLGLLLVAAAMFTGCKKDTDDGPRDIAAPLFDASELTGTESRIELSTGKWTIRVVNEDDKQGYPSRTGSEVTCTIDENGRVDRTSDFTYIQTIIITADHDISSIEKDFYTAMGYDVNGKTVSFCGEMNKAKYDEFDEEFGNTLNMSSSNENYKNYMTYTSFLSLCTDIRYISTEDDWEGGAVKTNADNTKYFGEVDGDDWYCSKIQ